MLVRESGSLGMTCRRLGDGRIAGQSAHGDEDDSLSMCRGS